MMDTFEAISSRRSVKHYDAAHVMPEADLNKLLEAAMLSPTSFNIQHWRFVVVRDKELRRRLRAAGNDQAQITDASVLIVMTADVQAWRKAPERYWRNAPPEVSKMIVSWIGPFYDGREWIQRDEAMRSMGIAAQTIMLAAKALGYDTCPMIGFDQEKTAELINLPGDHVIGLMIAVGKATKPAAPRSGQLGAGEVVVYDRF